MIVDQVWKLVLSAVLGTALIGGIAYWATRDRPLEMTDLGKQLAQTATTDFAKKLPRTTEVSRCLLIISSRGSSDQAKKLKEMLREAIDRTGKYRLETWADVENQLKGNKLAQFLAAIGLAPGVEPSNLEQAVKACKQLDERVNLTIDGVLFVETSLQEGADEDGFGTRIDLRGRLWSVKQDKLLSDGPVIEEKIDSRLDGRYVSYSIGRQSFLGRLFLWFLASAGAPWLGIAVVRAVVRRKNNGMNLAMLALLTLFDLALFYVLVLAIDPGMLGAVALAVVAGLMGYYNYDACDYIERRLL
jgi:hypothetical protein